MSVKRDGSEPIVIRDPKAVWGQDTDNVYLQQPFWVLHKGEYMGTSYDPKDYVIELVLTPKFVPGFYMKRDWHPAVGTSNSTGPLWFTYQPNLDVWKRVTVTDDE